MSDQHASVTHDTLQRFADEVSQTLATVVTSLLAAADDGVSVVRQATDIDYEQFPEPTQAQLMFASAGTAFELGMIAFKDSLLQRLEEASKQ